MKLGMPRIPGILLRAAVSLVAVVTAISANPIGWGDPILVERNVDEYGVCCHEGEGRLYAVSAIPRSLFKADTPTIIDIVLAYTEAGIFKHKNVAEVTLAPSQQPFPIYPSVSAMGDEILIAWQETLPQGGAAGIYYVYSAGGPDAFGPRQPLPAAQGKANIILPVAKMTGTGRHSIFYQEPSSANRFSLTAANGARGVFTGTVSVAQISSSTRGSLFPSILRRGNRLDILYQNRADATLVDDIFRSFSIDAAGSWSQGIRVTENGSQNFSGSMTNTKDKLVFIWQSNPDRIWTIFAAPEDAAAIRVSENTTSSYLPAIVAGDDTLVAAWQDMRSGNPQIYGKFIDRPQNQHVGVDHAVTKDGISARPLVFARWGKRPYLFYGCGPGLCMREADTTAEAIQVTSKTHAMGKITKSSEVIFSWPKPADTSGIESFAYIIDDQKDTDPDLYNLNARATQITFPGLNGGAYYMHMKYRDLAGNQSPITHYPFVIDTVPPSRPIITSPTHESGIPDARKDVVVKFVSADDSGIQKYRYAMGAKLPRVFAEETTSTELAFNNVPDGKYVFAVEAIDLGGNVSERAYYRIEIGQNERNDLTIRHNAEADVITRTDIAFTIQDNGGRGIKEVYYLSGFDIRDPFTGKRVPLEKLENIYTARIKNLERGISVISLGIVYADGTRAAPRHFYFESNDPRAKKAFTFGDVQYEKLPPVRERDPIEVGGKAQIISSYFDRGILEIRLNYDKPKKVRIKGFVWEIASAERIPQGEINFSGPVEFIYLQKPGQYFLNAKTLFTGPERQQFAFDSRLVEVPDVRRQFRKNLYTALAGFLILLLLLAVWQRRRLAFYAGAWI
jgi:hypothetical protein